MMNYLSPHRKDNHHKNLSPTIYTLMMKTEKMYFSHEVNDNNDKIEHIQPQQINWKI